MKKNEERNRGRRRRAAAVGRKEGRKRERVKWAELGIGRERKGEQIQKEITKKFHRRERKKERKKERKRSTIS